MIRLTIASLLIFFSLTVFAQRPGVDVFNFNSGWKVKSGDSTLIASAPEASEAGWKSVTLPYAWNEDEAFKKGIAQLSTGIAWYRKQFSLPATAKDKKVFLEFEGLRFGADIYLNGKLIATHDNGVMAFGLDLTDHLKPGNNLIAVRVDNSWTYKEKATGTTFQWNDRNFFANYGGITKNVKLHIKDKLYQTLPLFSYLKTTGPYIYAKEYDIPRKSATVFIESEVKNEYDTDQSVVLEAEIRDAAGKVVKTLASTPKSVKAGELAKIEVSARITGLNFWSWGYGYLYTVTTRLKVAGAVKDQVATVTGFRKTEFKNGMIYLNDKVIMMHGFAQRTNNEWPAVGDAVPAWLSDYNNAMMVEGGGNVVRWMHVTPWKQDSESCDRVGLIQAMPAGDAERDSEGRKWELRVQLMRDAIVYNRNSPSILFYEGGNESISRAHMVEMKAVRDKYDPYGGRATGSREMLDIAEAEYGGEMLYVNKSATKPLWAMEYARDEGHRKYWDDFTPPYHKNGEGPLVKIGSAAGTSGAAYNKNQDRFAIDAVSQWYDYWLERPGTGNRVSAGGVSIMFSESNTFTRSAFNYRTSGKTDAMRIPKDAFFAGQVMWDGWVNPDPKGMHIIGHWNYEPSVTKEIYVVSAGEKVELFLNGKSLGFGKQSTRFLFTFGPVKFEPGILKAVSYTAAGKKLAEKQLETSGAPVALRLKAIQNPKGFRADGADLVLAEIEVVDAKGNRCPTALNMIDFDLTGPAEWRGGIAEGPGNYVLEKSLPVQAGVNRVFLRSTIQAGKIVLTARSAGLTPATLTLETTPISSENGLSAVFPADGLKGRLDRGPTPTTATYTVVRRSVPIQGAIAGANPDKVKASYDDNELSNWSNDGKLSTAWITYTLEKPTKVNGMAFKLNNFRSRNYAITIMVDDKVVFSGDSRAGLGYYNQEFTPTLGSKVTVKLEGRAARQNAVDIGVEVTGQRLTDGTSQTNANAAATLSIIEADIFQP